MLAGVQGSAGQFAVHIVGGGNQHHVKQVAGQEGFQRVKGSQTHLAGLLHALGQNVVCGDHFHALYAGRVFQMPVAHIAKTNNTKLYTHVLFLLCTFTIEARLVYH